MWYVTVWEKDRGEIEVFACDSEKMALRLEDNLRASGKDAFHHFDPDGKEDME